MITYRPYDTHSPVNSRQKRASGTNQNGILRAGMSSIRFEDKTTWAQRASRCKQAQRSRVADPDAHHHSESAFIIAVTIPATEGAAKELERIFSTSIKFYKLT